MCRTQSDSPLQRKLVILTAEISTDDDPPESVSMELSQAPAKSSPQRSESPVDISFRSANSGSADTDAASCITKTGSFESLISSLDTKSMVTAVSGDGSERSSTPTELDNQYSFIRSIKSQLELMENKCQALMEENEQLRRSDWALAETESSATATANGTNVDTIKRKPKSSAQTPTKSDSERIAELREKLAAAESMYQDYKEENLVLKCELRELQESMTEKSEAAEVRDLKAKLAAAESLCEEMMEENESLKRETQDFQREIEELQDQYREEELSELRDVQKELESKAKDCRVLQFKLRKAERKCEQAEADKSHMEEKLQDLMAAQGATEMIDTPKIKELELELRIAKEVSVRLHNELEAAEEKRVKMEEEVFIYKERARELELKEKLKSKPPSPRSTPKFGPKSGTEGNNAQLLRDLNDALERETDLRVSLMSHSSLKLVKC